MGELVNVPIGSVGNVKLDFNNGELMLSIGAKVTVDQILTLVKNAIPGDFDNKLIDGLRDLLDGK
jgi:hypothetical protein